MIGFGCYLWVMFLIWTLDSPSHHEAGKVCHMKLLFHINRHVNAKSNKGKQKPRRHERESQPGQIARERENEKHHRSRHIRRHRVQIRLDSLVSQPANNLRQKQLHRLQRHAEADLDAQDEPRGRMFKDGEGIPQVEFFVDDGGGVGLHAVVGEVFLLLGEEVGVRG